jgi:predicted Fe-S protein YdhL (DUF1289 family)
MSSMAAMERGVASPCIEVCRLSPDTGYCDGCRRTIAEIAGWSGYSDDEKRAVLEQLPRRKQRP